MGRQATGSVPRSRWMATRWWWLRPAGCRLRVVIAAGAPVVTIAVEPDGDGARVHPVFAPRGL